MAGRRKGFTLVEVIVVLVILAILAAILIPSMTGWIDKAKEKRLIVACRTCVLAAQTLASKAYGEDGVKTPPEGAAVVDYAGVKGIASGITLDTASVAIDSLTYSEGAEDVTYTRLPSPHYTYGSGIAGITASVWDWAKNHTRSREEKDFLTRDYGNENPTALTEAQMKAIFGNLEPAKQTQYIYPMGIYDANGKLLNIQYVTPQNPTLTGPPNRYQASAFIIDGKTYISQFKENGNVKAIISGAKDGGNDFQSVMNGRTFASTQDFVDFITSTGYFKLAE